MGAKFKRIMARYWQLYLFLLPPAVYTLIFLYYPMTGVQLAFKDFDYALGIWGSGSSGNSFPAICLRGS